MGQPLIVGCAKKLMRFGGKILKNINPLLSVDLLFALRLMGHGDDIIIGDVNFPGDTIASETTLGTVIRTDNVSTAEIVRAILSVMPLDTLVDDAAGRMQLVRAAEEILSVQQEVQKMKLMLRKKTPPHC